MGGCASHEPVDSYRASPAPTSQPQARPQPVPVSAKQAVDADVASKSPMNAGGSAGTGTAIGSGGDIAPIILPQPPVQSYDEFIAGFNANARRRHNECTLAVDQRTTNELLQTELAAFIPVQQLIAIVAAYASSPYVCSTLDYGGRSRYARSQFGDTPVCIARFKPNGQYLPPEAVAPHALQLMLITSGFDDTALYTEVTAWTRATLSSGRMLHIGPTLPGCLHWVAPSPTPFTRTVYRYDLRGLCYEPYDRALLFSDGNHHSILSYSQALVTTWLCGGISPDTPGLCDGDGGTARFRCPTGIVCGVGKAPRLPVEWQRLYAYVCDTGNNALRFVDFPARGLNENPRIFAHEEVVVRTHQTPDLKEPTYLAWDETADVTERTVLFITAREGVWKFTTTDAKFEKLLLSGDGALSPAGICWLCDYTLAVSCRRTHSIYRIDTRSGECQLLAGAGCVNSGAYVDGASHGARFCNPNSLEVVDAKCFGRREHSHARGDVLARRSIVVCDSGNGMLRWIEAFW